MNEIGMINIFDPSAQILKLYIIDLRISLFFFNAHSSLTNGIYTYQLNKMMHGYGRGFPKFQNI